MGANGHALTTWNKGDRLDAASLNSNFLKLYEMVIEALAQSRMPDGAVVGLEMAQGRLAKRVEGLEQLTAMHAHQRNEMQYTPLSYHAAVIIMVNDLRKEVEEAIGAAKQMHTSLGLDHDDLHARMLRIEQQSDAANKEEFAALARDCERGAVDLRRALAEIVELRHEVKILRDRGARNA